MTMSLNEALAEVINDLIEKRGMTMASLARVTGVSRESIRNYIQRGRTMPVDVLAKLAPGLGLSAFELVQLAEDVRDEATPDMPAARSPIQRMPESVKGRH